MKNVRRSRHRHRHETTNRTTALVLLDRYPVGWETKTLKRLQLL
ncbi:hypothetical protein [Chamaesiphon sp. OTE_20_metabat_361]|nr:hypothetical protein [Chamaesiphon sp. OTE_20_metabat_361]